MPAGGFKTFVAGEILTAADTNAFLMQGILVFADATARDAAITAPVEGQFAFLTSVNELFFYDGAAWEEFFTGPKSAKVSGTTGAPTVTSGAVIDGFEYDLYTFTGDGSITISEGGVCDVLTVGGGGGGQTDGIDANRRAGGGAGGVRLLHSFIAAGTYTVTVGPGGAAASNGSASSLGTLARVGGGQGGNARTGVALTVNGFGGGGSSGAVSEGGSGFTRGGGAGGTVSGSNNFDGHPVAITGTNVTYGFASDTGGTGAANTGNSGGAGNTSGGSGIVIVRVAV
jgi:hypothetical protein